MKWYVAFPLKLNSYFWFKRQMFVIKLLKSEMPRRSYFLII